MTGAGPDVAVADQIPMPRRAMPATRQAQGPARVRIAFPVVLYFLAVLLPIGFNLGPITMTGVRLVLIAMILPLTVQLAMGRFGRILATDILFFLHVMWIVVALAVNNPDQAVANAGSTGIEFIGGYALGRAYIRTAADFTALIKLLATVALCTLPFALYETVTGHAIILNLLAKLPGIIEPARPHDRQAAGAQPGAVRLRASDPLRAVLHLGAVALLCRAEGHLQRHPARSSSRGSSGSAVFWRCRAAPSSRSRCRSS